MKLKEYNYSYLSSILSEVFTSMIIKESDSFTEKAREFNPNGTHFHIESSNYLTKTVLVVLDEHTLGYVLPELPDDVQILHTSPLKGSPTTSLLTSSFPIGSQSNIRLASEKDFDEFRVSFEGFKNTLNYIYKQ